MDTPSTSYPCSQSRAAATDESTPPLMATNTLLTLLIFRFSFDRQESLVQFGNAPAEAIDGIAEWVGQRPVLEVVVVLTLLVHNRLPSVHHLSRYAYHGG